MTHRSGAGARHRRFSEYRRSFAYRIDVSFRAAAIYSPSGGSVGIGFDIPGPTAEMVIAQLKEKGTVTRAWLGVRAQPVTAGIAESIGMNKAQGALIDEAEPGASRSTFPNTESINAQRWNGCCAGEFPVRRGPISAELELQGAESQTAAGARLAREKPVLRAGDTCWKIARAGRFAVIVDAAEYFAQVKAAMLKARRSILLIGWDFDLRIRLTPDQGDDREVRLGDLLRTLVRQQRKLRIYILKWDMAVLYTLRWQSVPLLFTDLITARHIHLRFDSTHPATSAHHQKIVVIDDAIAFCGGIDMTDDRWDTRSHRAGDRHRVNPERTEYGPWHDSTTAVDGEAARALGELARQRWLFATGQRLPKPEQTLDAWPEGLVPQLQGVNVGIARTMPAYEGRDAAREIEGLYIAAIRSARHLIYIESQFFAAARIVDALREQLRQPDGPEIIVINPLHGKSWLEEQTMDCARALLLKRLRATDRRGRFHIYYPVNEADDPIYVHSKVLVIDDRLLRVGSSNINNRSMGFDSECDLAIEAAKHDHERRAAIARIRNRLLAEHLGRSEAEIARAIDEGGSAVFAVERLCRPRGRRLVPLPPRPINAVEEAVAASRIADPESSAVKDGIVGHAIKRLILRRPLAASAGLLSLTIAACFLGRLANRRGHRRLRRWYRL